MYKFSENSLEKLATCHPKLAAVVKRALSYQVMDITVLQGARTTEEQQEAFRKGNSKLDGVTKFSKHQVGGNTGRTGALAVDIAPYPVDWDNALAFHVLAGLMMAAAAEEGVKLRWGGDWDSDFSNKDQTFHDLPHFELAVDK